MLDKIRMIELDPGDHDVRFIGPVGKRGKLYRLTNMGGVPYSCIYHERRWVFSQETANEKDMVGTYLRTNPDSFPEPEEEDKEAVAIRNLIQNFELSIRPQVEPATRIKAVVDLLDDYDNLSALFRDREKVIPILIRLGGDLLKTYKQKYFKEFK